MSEKSLRFVFELEQENKNLGRFDGKRGVLDHRQRKSAEMSIPFQQACAQRTCKIDLQVFAEVDSKFDAPFIIGSSAFITLIFTVFNAGFDSAYQPILKIPLASYNVLRKPSYCEDIVSC